MRGTGRKRVVIIGGGFGGVSAARALAKAPVDITLVDRTNHHLFQPLLYQVATAGISPGDIAVPIRWLLRRQRNIEVLLAEVQRVDPITRTVTLDVEPHTLSYDYLVVAAGVRHAYFGHDEWAPLAPGLKTLADAADIRKRFLLAFERAERTTDLEARAALQTIVVVGAGPTGVELAGIIPEITRTALRREFRHIDTAATRVLLVEAGPRVLPAFDPALSAAALRDLQRLGVEVRLNAPVTAVTATSVTVGSEIIPTETVFWAAGNVGAPVSRALGVPLDRAGRVPVDADLSVAGHPEFFVVGDLARIERNGAVVPGVAPAANQAGAHAGRMVARLARGEGTVPFVYHHKGDLATIGRHKGVAKLGPLTLSGVLAWWTWLFIHLLYLVGFRNRVSVLLQWGYAYVTFQRGVRLLNGTTVSIDDAPASRAAAA
ncbi:MAG: NAD(P)/FAD-dependent oxidoreductase [Gemmatimonadaceae bacterium]|nr:NAD(P)/FAD-dependent oxidoreductase [Gemmatimonadaceae bacterium]